jgi:hypothetical protein
MHFKKFFIDSYAALNVPALEGSNREDKISEWYGRV